jgi:hypothetical protein
MNPVAVTSMRTQLLRRCRITRGVRDDGHRGPEGIMATSALVVCLEHSSVTGDYGAGPHFLLSYSNLSPQQGF